MPLRRDDFGELNAVRMDECFELLLNVIRLKLSAMTQTSPKKEEPTYVFGSGV